ncbi:MAG TPA: ABC transporter substrate-binding protein [Gaiellaceae bacterium]|nr:ABC transporter substrate-binding protein [Gaiellaceae bacterium]
MLTVAGSAGASQVSYPRSQTLITSGTQWGTIAGFNPYAGSYAAGMIGLNLETLLRYDPIKDKYINWLAKSAKWTGAKQFTISVRPNVKWGDGKKFVAKDVLFNLKLLRFKTSQWNNLYLNIKSIKVKGSNVVIGFKSTPNYIQWQNAMWNIPMISPAQGKVITSAQKLTTYNPKNPVGTGPYALDKKGFDPTTRVVWVKKAHWWASDQGKQPTPKPKYIIDLVNTSNTNSLSAVLAGVEDLNNNFLPGVNKLADRKRVLTYFPKAPYMLSANTAWLEPNTTVKPLNNPLFRRALAMAVNPKKYAQQAESGLVLKADPTGLLPTWKKYIDPTAVQDYGFTYSTNKAVALLKKAGYKKGSDGYFMNKDGSKIDLSIMVPQGWSDWEAARDMIIADAKAAGIRLHAVIGDQNAWISARGTGHFDLALDNHWQISDNPWTYWNGIFHLPILTTGTGQVNFNFERYSNPKAWALVQELDKTPLNNKNRIEFINNQLQTILMKNLPLIPLWYNGQWAQFTTLRWTNWPNSTNRQFTPVMWGGYLQMTGIDMITHLKPVQ